MDWEQTAETGLVPAFKRCLRCTQPADFEGASQLVSANREEAEQMITAIASLDDIIAGGFFELINNKANHVKILIEVGGE